MEESLDLKVLLGVLKKYILLMLAAAAVLGIAGFWYVNTFTEPTYKSEALIYVQSSAAQKTETLNSGDIVTAQKMAETCKILFTSSTMMDNLITELDLPYNKLKLSKMITVAPVNSTEVMQLTAKCSDPQEAQTIVNKLADLSIVEFNRVVKYGSIEIINYGEVNADPVDGNKLKITAICIFLGLVLVYGVGFLREMFDVAVKSDDDLAKLYNVPVFAEINDFAAKGKGGKYGYGYGYGEKFEKKASVGNSNSKFLNEDTPFAIAEAYKTARTNIMFAVAPSKRKIIAVTSSNPSEGKSTTCANIAIVFAHAGYKILLIDCDLRKPTVKSNFSINNNNGLSGVLGGFCTLEDAVNVNIYDGLDVLTAGDVPPNPSELLGSEAMKALLVSATSVYDYIFLDTPPVNVVTDSQLLNDVAAGLVFVVKESFTTHPAIEEALEKINLANGKTLGFVKTFCARSKSKRYGKYGNKYSYDYKYGDNVQKNAAEKG